jgi:anaerobic magnesium-protoporphyrin IX monomethyl ester cyclase
MKVVLIAPPIMDMVEQQLRPIAQDATRNCPPYGLYLLANILRERQHEVIIVDLIAAGTNRLAPSSRIVANADLIGITTSSLSWPTAVDVIRQIRRLHVRAPIVLGGVHATMFDVYALEHFPVQYVIRGEAEIALPALCEAVERNRGIETVPNLSWKTKTNKVIRNPIGPLIESADLGSYPLPAFDLMPRGVYQSLSIESSRGCAFDCSFCSTSYRQSWRSISPAIFVDRLERTMAYRPRTICGAIHIVDDEFSIKTKRAVEIVRLLETRHLRPALVYDTRANDLLDDKFTEAIAPFTNQFLVGAECGYDEGLHKIGKQTTCAKLEGAARKLRQYGISQRANFSFILGLPWEGRQEIEKTINFASRLYGEYGVKILLQGYCLIPGSRLWQGQREKLVLTEPMYDEFGFFRNLHFWYTSQRVSPSEAWEIEDLILGLQWLAHLAHPGKHMIQHSVSWSLSKYFPRSILNPKSEYAVGLESLRQVAHRSRSERPDERVAEDFTGSRGGLEATHVSVDQIAAPIAAPSSGTASEKEPRGLN